MMRLRWRIALALIVIGVCGGLIAYGLAWPMGEGSYWEAVMMRRQLTGVRGSGKVAAGQLPAGFYRFDFPDGSWVVATGSDSHHDLTGGTSGFLFNDGRIVICFGHVCGPGSTPLEGVFGVDSAKSFDPAVSDWHEWEPGNH